jgi:hypothetical protein
MPETIQNWEGWIWFFSFLGIAIIIHYISFRTFEGFARRTPIAIDDSLVKYTRGPSQLIILFITARLALPQLPILRDTLLSSA